MLDSFQPIAEALHYTKWSASQSASQNRKDNPQKKKEADQFLFSSVWANRVLDILDI